MSRGKWAVAVVLAACLVATAAVVVYAAGQPKTAAPVQEVVRAREFQLVDDHGKARATMGYDSKGDSVAIAVLDSQQRPRVGLTMAGGLGALVLLDAQGRQRAVVFSDELGGAGLRLFDDDGQQCADLEVSREAGIGLGLIGRGRRGSASLVVKPDSSARLDMRDASFKERVSLGVSDSRPARLALRDSQGEERSVWASMGKGTQPWFFSIPPGHSGLHSRCTLGGTQALPCWISPVELAALLH